MHLYIDTNNYLSFYHYSSNDLEELRKLIVLLSEQLLILQLPEQVVNEFFRNRDNKVAHALKVFQAEKLTNKFPNMCKEYEEYERLRNLIETYEKTKNALLEKVKDDFKNVRLKADTIIE